jgi:hypothetical protein
MLNPLFYAVLALALTVFALLALYVSLRRDYILLRRQQADQNQQISTASAELQVEVTRLTEEVAALRPAPRAMAGQTETPNQSRLTHVLRMRARGDSPARIASALGMNRGEVELLLKLQRAVSPPPQESRASAEWSAQEHASIATSDAAPLDRANSAAIYATA